MRKSIFVSVVCGLLWLLPIGASAHTVSFWHGADYATVSSSHLSVTVCDMESDGDLFFVKLRLGNDQTGTVSDWNGSASPCRVGSFSSPIVTIQLCEQTNSWTGAHNCTWVKSVG